MSDDAFEIVRADVDPDQRPTLIATAPSLEAAAGAIATVAREDRVSPEVFEVRVRGDEAVRAAYVPPPRLDETVACLVAGGAEVRITSGGDGRVDILPGCRGGRPAESCLCAGLAAAKESWGPETALGLIRDLWADAGHLSPGDPGVFEAFRRAVQIAREQLDIAEARARQIREARELAARTPEERERSALEAFDIVGGAA
jgi:hypothetical protein